MTQIEQKTANAAAKREPDGGILTSTNSPDSINTILDRIAGGDYVPDIAKELGITKQALSQRLRRHDVEAYAAAREVGMELRLDAGLARLEKEADSPEPNVDLARVMDMTLRRLEWRASVEHPHRWGQRPTTAINVGGDGMQVQIVSYAVVPQTPAELTLPEVLEK